MSHYSLHRWVLTLLIFSLTALLPAQENTRYFLDIPGIPGEATEKAYLNQICITAYSWGISNSGTTHLGGGSGTGKASISDFSFAKNLDRSTPDLFHAVASGSQLPSMTFTVVRVDETGKMVPFVKYNLENILITSLQPGAGESGVQGESFSVNFGKITITQYDRAGQPNNVKSWNIVENTPE